MIRNFFFSRPFDTVGVMLNHMLAGVRRIRKLITLFDRLGVIKSAEGAK